MPAPAGVERSAIPGATSTPMTDGLPFSSWAAVAAPIPPADPVITMVREGPAFLTVRQRVVAVDD
jgi:hypothetical protein